jgi:hypothetical protein
MKDGNYEVMTASLKMKNGAIRYMKIKVRNGADGLPAPPPEIHTEHAVYALTGISDQIGTVFYQQT